MPDSSDLRKRGFIALMIAVFINALNDNFFRLVMLFVAIREFVFKGDGTFYYSLVGFVFLLPFVLFSPWAGFVADRFSKKKVIVFTRVTEAAVLSLGALMLLTYNIPGLFVALFLMGTQSSFFSPLKFSILPEIVRPEQLSRANGHLQFWTFLAIICGTALAGIVMELAGERLWVPGAVAVPMAVLGLLSSLFITPTTAERHVSPFRLNPLRTVLGALGEIRESRLLFLVILGIAYFWALGMLYQLNVPLFAELQLDVGELETGIILTMLAVGIGTGSIACGYLARGRIELRYIPAGVVATALFSFLLYFARDSYPGTLLLTLMLGIGAGFFIVPITAYLQYSSPVARRGRFIAASNFLSFGAMLTAPVVFWILTGPLGAEPTQIFVISALVSVMVLSWAVRQYRYTSQRFQSP
jgi:MFS family permease